VYGHGRPHLDEEILARDNALGDALRDGLANLQLVACRGPPEGVDIGVDG